SSPKMAATMKKAVSRALGALDQSGLGRGMLGVLSFEAWHQPRGEAYLLALSIFLGTWPAEAGLRGWGQEPWRAQGLLPRCRG
ncbi:hypothetical protein P7K49_009934, partial [Saguinus oedipus]